MGGKQINQDLTDEQKDVLFNAGTEAPFSGEFLNHSENGMYTCVNCGAELFKSDSKYESDIAGLAGWPSYAEAVKDGAVELKDDTSHGMQRTEVLCGNCGAHLGHVFDDAGSPTGQHYCINSVCLGFTPQSGKKEE